MCYKCHGLPVLSVDHVLLVSWASCVIISFHASPENDVVSVGNVVIPNLFMHEMGY